ncbi:uncharacterized protein CLUP02_00607 [Colletotrichum lupini]|uniref:Uncharacterized protein n=1 Tax=Colletotrichum lupini TaxID=145971 RepID=A0A9Q8SBE9_9PEZI|nr:uncharacterized protein CLUP02_00607 [Colletotrichum lupini]UQC73960.1 hypothetical protein CLUP02_00607 [Colletotrichum lupini]
MNTNCHVFLGQLHYAYCFVRGRDYDLLRSPPLGSRLRTLIRQAVIIREEKDESILNFTFDASHIDTMGLHFLRRLCLGPNLSFCIQHESSTCYRNAELALRMLLCIQAPPYHVDLVTSAYFANFMFTKPRALSLTPEVALEGSGSGLLSEYLTASPGRTGPWAEHEWFETNLCRGRATNVFSRLLLIQWYHGHEFRGRILTCFSTKLTRGSGAPTNMYVSNTNLAAARHKRGTRIDHRDRRRSQDGLCRLD